MSLTKIDNTSIIQIQFSYVASAHSRAHPAKKPVSLERLPKKGKARCARRWVVFHRYIYIATPDWVTQTCALTDVIDYVYDVCIRAHQFCINEWSSPWVSELLLSAGPTDSKVSCFIVAIFLFRWYVRIFQATRWDIIRIGQRGIVLCGQTAFSVIIICGGRKTEKQSLDMPRLHTRVAMEEGLLSVWVSQSIGQSWSVDENCYLLNSGFARTTL